MTKPRVHGIAKDINIKSQEILDLLEQHNFPPKSHMSTLDTKEADLILDFYTQKNSVENFDFLLEKLTQETKAKEQREKEKQEVIEEVAEINKPIVKKAHYVDTRTTNVDLDKYDTEHIETLVPDKLPEVDAPNAKQKVVKKQKPTGFTKPNDNKQNKPGQQNRQGQQNKPGQQNRPGNKQQENRFDKRNNRDKQQPVQHGKQQHKQHQQPMQAEKPRKKVDEVSIPEEITVLELARRLGQPAPAIVKKLFAIGVMASITQVIDHDAAALIATDFGANVIKETTLSAEEILFNDVEDNENDLQSRPPVVVVMGHVDHGKTKLLDAIRNTNVIATEAGGITQHIGAYSVNVHGNNLTFLDTPGHAAFTSMRARGAQVTDIAILVVSAEDGIMPQTIEAINHAKEAGVNIIVAVNKIDKDTANPDVVKQQLTEHGLVVEEWGGDTICVPISAKFGTNIDQLLEMVILSAEMKELKANPNRAAKGTVIESRLDKQRGPVATVLVQNGTLKAGDIIVAGQSVGRVRVMYDDKAKKVNKAGPSTPVEIIGLSEAPDAGDLFYAVADEKKAREVVAERKQKIKDEQLKSSNIVSLSDIFNKIKEGQFKNLNIILKADVQGSVEALKQSLEKLSNDEVRVRVIHGAVGAITESDIMLAHASGAIIVGFNVRPDATTSEIAAMQKVEIRLYSVIYNAINEVEAAMKGMLQPVYVDTVLGHVEVRQVFKVTGVGAIAGCYVTDGKVTRSSNVRILRNGIVVHDGKIDNLKRFKDDAKEVMSGYECGIQIERFNDVKESDIFEIYVTEEVKR